MPPLINNPEVRILSELRDNDSIFAAIDDWEGGELRLQETLRAEYPVDVVRAAITLHELRRRASGRFSRADRMWFDRVGLEQATCEAVANHKAARFSGHVVDLCSGIGGDAIALAGRCDVSAVDRNTTNCFRLVLNATAYGCAQRIQPVCADVETLALRNQLVHIDPDRRAGRRGRSLRVEDCRPDLQFLKSLIRTARGGAIKLSPAGNFGGKFEDVEIELVSLDGECREATVWFGETAGNTPYRATVLPDGATIAGDPLESFSDISPVQRFLYDPDPAVVRAGLVDRLCEESGYRRLDDAEEYLTSADLIASPFARPFEVIADLPAGERDVRAWFRTADVGQVEIKCRHVPVNVNSYRRKLRLSGTGAATVIIARVAGKTRTLICRRC